MTLLMALTALFMLALIICGGVYISAYERAPLYERVQVLGVGYGMWLGIILMYC